MAQRVLITGGSGFVGQWLCRAMLEQGRSVFAGTIEGAPRGGLLSEKERTAICWTPLDVLSDESVRAAVQQAAPDRVIHLAGIAFPPEANASPAHTFEVNALGVVRLLSVLAPAAASGVRVLVVGSAEQYGAHPASDYPLREDAAQQPLTTYAASKAAQEVVALQCARTSALHVICTRSFNHSGLGHGDQYLLPSLVRRARELPPRGGTLRIGNSTPQRDFLHVSDVVEAYMLLLEKGATGEVYNVASGHALSVRQLAERVLNRLRVSAEIAEDPALVRPSDMPVLVGDNAKLRRTTGWMPQRTIDDIIDDLIHAAPR
jgi:GDP-4-dehydro-6-deoxy-D-mannose reductase